MWVVRAGRGARYLDAFLEQGIVGVGSSRDVGAEALTDSRKDLTKRTAEAHPGWSKHKVANQAGQLYRFIHEISVSDDVATYDPGQRRYLLGTVSGEARFQPDQDGGLPYVRKVRWTHRVARDSLTTTTRNTLGAIQSLFRLSREASVEMHKVAVALDAPESAPVPVAVEPEQDTTLADLRAEVVEKAAEFIEDMLAALDPYDMQDLVAGVLRAMGYKTRVSPRGADRGVDIFASPDGLGLEEPRIFVEVKHRRNSTMGSQELRAFMGGRQPGDRCLYVSSGGFTKDARYEAERSNVPLTLLGLPELRELLMEHYEALDIETKRLVPLTRLYWPVAEG